MKQPHGQQPAQRGALEPGHDNLAAAWFGHEDRVHACHACTATSTDKTISAPPEAYLRLRIFLPKRAHRSVPELGDALSITTASTATTVTTAGMAGAVGGPSSTPAARATQISEVTFCVVTRRPRSKPHTTPRGPGRSRWIRR